VAVVVIMLVPSLSLRSAAEEHSCHSYMVDMNLKTDVNGEFFLQKLQSSYATIQDAPGLQNQWRTHNESMNIHNLAMDIL